MKVHCRIKYRNFDTPQGLKETLSEVMSLDDLFDALVDGENHDSIYSIIIEGPSRGGDSTRVILDISTITHDIKP